MLTSSYPNLRIVMRWDILKVLAKGLHRVSCNGPVTNCVSELLVSLVANNYVLFAILLISTQVTYLVCGLLFVLVVEEWVWGYAVSVTILHVVITSTGKQDTTKETKYIKSDVVLKLIHTSRTLLYVYCPLMAK